MRFPKWPIFWNSKIGKLLSPNVILSHLKDPSLRVWQIVIRNDKSTIQQKSKKSLFWKSAATSRKPSIKKHSRKNSQLSICSNKDDQMLFKGQNLLTVWNKIFSTVVCVWLFPIFLEYSFLKSENGLEKLDPLILILPWFT